MKPDHEAAKKWAEDVWDTLKDTALHEVLEADAIDHRNAAACYLDAMARLDKAEKAGESWKDAYFKLIRAIGSSPNCSKSPVSIAQELLAQRDEAEKLRDVAYGLLDVAVKERDEALALLEKIAASDDWSGGLSNTSHQECARAFLAKHRKNAKENHNALPEKTVAPPDPQA